ncbi:MAG: hypothetical protein DHS80DRAFT_12749 [Piptocephalis tieghemiana]|nr:MAG: hypothetical protein DHS80DRAFT_12749 [Piptocephalis tieghemiana]
MGGSGGGERGGEGEGGAPVPRSLGGPFVWGRKGVTEHRMYVGNLAYPVRAADLRELFSKYGEVVYAEVLERMGRSQGGGLVEFSNASQKEEAMRALPNYLLLGRPIFMREDRVDSNVTPASRPPFPPSGGGVGPMGGGGGYGGPFGGAGGGAPGRTLWVGNLPYMVSWQQLKDVFREQGPVERADIQQDMSGRSRGSGVVTMARPEDATRAIRSLDGTMWAGRRIEVREDRHSMGGGGGGFGPPGGGGPPPPPFGSTGSGSIHHGHHRGGGPPPYGAGGPTPRPSYSMGPGRRAGRPYDDALPTGPGQGRGLSGGRGGPSSSSSPTPSLVVTNLPYSTTREDLEDLFKAFGPMDRCVLDVDASGATLGTGSVLYLSQQAADRSVSKLNGYIYGGRKLDVRYNHGRRV